MEERNPGVFRSSCLYLLSCVGLWVVSLAAELFYGNMANLNAFSLEMVVGALYYLPFLALPVLLTQRRAPGMLRLNPISVPDALCVCAAAFSCMMLGIVLLTFWAGILQFFGLNVYSQSRIAPGNRSELFTSLITSAIMAPICEEMLFRGAMLSAWETRGARKAVWVTAVLFAMLHGSVTGFPVHCVVGLLLALVVLYTDSLYAGLIFHTVYNASLTLVSYYASVKNASAQSAPPTGTLWESMGASGVIGATISAAICILILQKIMQALCIRHKCKRMLAECANGNFPATDAEALKKAFKSYSLLPPQTDTRPLRTSTILVLMAGIASSIVLFIVNLLSML